MDLQELLKAQMSSKLGIAMNVVFAAASVLGTVLYGKDAIKGIMLRKLMK